MIQVAIIEDNIEYRDAVSMIINLQDDMAMLHTLENCDGMMECFKDSLPDLILMDIDLPGINGIEAIWKIRKEYPALTVLILTIFEDEDKIFGAFKAGANGYLLKKDSPVKIVDAIREAHRGASPMNGFIATKVLEFFHRRKNDDINESILTAREKEVLQLLIKGLSYKDIAGNLFISSETLNSHIKNIYRKLDVHSRSELAAKFNQR